MYKIFYTGRDYPEEVESMINAEQYETREQAEENKALTMQLLGIDAEGLKIKDCPKYESEVRVEYFDRLTTAANRIKNLVSILKTREKRQPLTDAEVESIASYAEQIELIKIKILDII